MVANNHFQGKGIVNALQLISALGGVQSESAGIALRQRYQQSWKRSPTNRRRNLHFISNVKQWNLGFFDVRIYAE